MKKFLSVLLSIFLTIALFITLLLGVVKEVAKPSVIKDLVMQAGKSVSVMEKNDGLYYLGQKILRTTQFDEGFDFSSFDLSSIDFTNLDIPSLIKEYATEFDYEIDEELIEEVLSDPETSKLLDKYSYEIIDYMTGTSDSLTIDSTEITSLVNKTIDKYEEKTGEVIDRTGLDEMITENISAASEEIVSALDEVKNENSEVIKDLKLVMDILSTKTFVICVLVCICFALLILIVNLNIFTTLKYLSISSLIAGILVVMVVVVANGSLSFATNLIMKEFELSQGLLDFAAGIIISILKKLMINGIVAAVAGLILLIVSIIFGNKKPVAVKTSASDETIAVEKE